MAIVLIPAAVTRVACLEGMLSKQVTPGEFSAYTYMQHLIASSGPNSPSGLQMCIVCCTYMLTCGSSTKVEQDDAVAAVRWVLWVTAVSSALLVSTYPP